MMEDNTKKENKLIKLYKKFSSDEATIKRVPIYFFIICICLFVLLFKLAETNKYLKVIAENGTNLIEAETFDENYESVSKTFIEEPKTPEEILPYLEEVKNDSNDNEQNLSVKSYVINTDSKKIHYSDCSFAERIKEENKKTVNLTDDELKEYTNQGYTICSTCGGK